ncbi:MAG: hypothetical protein U9R42_01440 [Bacteroidota bacterium]|nr:hypothetical protein [Bacteroidota bacterium]
MYLENIEIDAVRADDDQFWRIHRIQMVLGYAQVLADIDNNEEYYKKLNSVYEHKGLLFIDWKTKPTKKEKEYWDKAWESVVTDYEGDLIEHTVNHKAKDKWII